MEIIRINDTKLKVTLDDGDMERYALSAETMDYDNTATRRVLWQILDEAKRRTGFDAAADRALIQAYPGRRGGCEIYVTLLSGGGSPLATGGRVLIYPFRDASLLFTVCRKLSLCGEAYESALYEDGEAGIYYLLIRETPSDALLPKSALSPISFVEEYTERLTGGGRLAYIKERAVPVLSERAIERLAELAAEDTAQAVPTSAEEHASGAVPPRSHEESLP